MFRMKKPPASEAEEKAAEPERREAPEEAIVKVPPRRPTPAQVPARPLGSTSFPMDVSRRPDLSSPVRSEPAPATVTRDKTIVVGKGVHLKGEVATCDKMVVDGEAEVTLTGCRHFHVGAPGVFRGSVDVIEAEIAGRFEGDLVSRERLTVRSSGVIKGTIRYGQLIIEAGGKVIGNMTTLNTEEAHPQSGGTHSDFTAPSPSSTVASAPSRGGENSFIALPEPS